MAPRGGDGVPPLRPQAELQRARAALVHRPIDPAALLDEVGHDGAGALTSFFGTVRDRNDGRAVLGIDYSAYEPMAEAELSRIADETVARWPMVRIAIEHRLGPLALRDVSVGIAVSDPHRADAFAACRFAIEEIKRRVPIWKREHYADGERRWVDPTAGGGLSSDSGAPVAGACAP